MKRFGRVPVILILSFILSVLCPARLFPAAAEEEAEATAAPLLRIGAQEGTGSPFTVETRDLSGTVQGGRAPGAGQIRMPAGDLYTRQMIGVLTFRSNAFRQNASVGAVQDPSSLRVLWKAETGNSPDGGEPSAGDVPAVQPLISKWSIQVREATEFLGDKRYQVVLKEVILPGADGSIHFLDLQDGSRTRAPLRADAPFTGVLALHPYGYPHLIAAVSSGLRQYNTYSMEELAAFPALNGQATPAGLSGAARATSPLTDGTSDTAVTAGSDGSLYFISLNTEFDWQNGKISVSPSTAAAKASADAAAVESPVSMYDRYVFYADMEGILRCVDTDTLAPLWTADTGDSVVAAAALDQPAGGGLDLYTGNLLNLRKEGKAQIRRYNALNGEELWCVGIGADRDPDGAAYTGCAASPVIGREELNDLVFFTVTGLNEKGRGLLDVPEGTRAAVVALEKETGALCWARGLSDRSISSPVAVYDEGGNGWIIQCAQDGTILLLDGLTGDEVSSLSVDGEIKASPAVFNSVMAVCTTGGTAYGILIGQ